MPNPLRRLDFWLISLTAIIIMSFGAQRWGWGQISRPGGSTPTPAQTALFDMQTGVQTGGLVTVNSGDSALFDVAAGTGWIVDCTTPSACTRTAISWPGVTAVTVTDLATTTFTSLTINSSGVVVQYPQILLSSAQRKAEIPIQGITHIDNATIGSVSLEYAGAYELVQALADVLRFIGIQIKGNTYEAASTNLTLKKLAGEAAGININRVVDPQNPSIQTDLEQDPVATVFYSHENAGATAFPVNIETVIDPDGYSPSGSDVIAVTTNRWTVQRINFFPQTGITVIEYGQFQYTSLANAQAAYPLEAHVENPNLDPGILVTVLFINEGPSNLSLIAEAVFQDL